MNSLKKIKLQHVYASEEIDVLHRFYIPVLSVAQEYWRLTGYFSSKALAVAAKGIGGLIKNNGKMKLITGFFTSKRDVMAARTAIEKPEEVIKELDEIVNSERLEDLFIRESIKALAWMLARGTLEIKVAVVNEEDIDGFDFIFHPKIGIIKDSYGNKLSFSGSINETGIAWLKNIEDFKVFRAWEESERRFFEPDNRRFVKLWNNLSGKVEVVPLPNAIKKRLIKIGREASEKINFDVLNGKLLQFEGTSLTGSAKKEKITLREYQNTALRNWIGNKNHGRIEGIIEMATGTGKTYVGLAAMLHYFNSREKGIIIVCAPRTEICEQWKNKIKKTIDYNSLILVGGGIHRWRREVENIIHDYKRDRKKRVVFISTYDSLKNLFDIIIGNNILDIFLLADEVHAFGARERRKVLTGSEVDRIVSHRMGLSATPKRMYDETGNEILRRFFGKTVYKYSLGNAIKQGVLCPYNYHMYVVEMTPQEFGEYYKFTKKIVQASHSSSISFGNEEEEYLTMLLNQRAKLIKSADNKIALIDKIIKMLLDDNDISYTFIFCIDTNQKNRVIDILDRYEKVIYSQITGEEGHYERSKILKDFSRGRIDLLLSMKILDEGIDIPVAKNAIILSSSTNPREYVQRRGRILRKVPNVEKVAKIFDFIVVPSLEKKFRGNLFDMERKILRKELTRAFYFAKYSQNRSDIFKNQLLTNLIERYRLEEIYDILKRDE